MKDMPECLLYGEVFLERLQGYCSLKQDQDSEKLKT